jgi:hypothetical protein
MVIMTRIKIVEKITKLKIKPLKKAHWILKNQNIFALFSG